MLNESPTLQPVAQNDDGMFVVMLVPACNEERHIRDTINSLKFQTRRPDRTIIILNNSDDGTGSIAMAMIPDFPGLEVLRMEHNPGKKAAALNFGLRSVKLTYKTVVGEMDADTKVAPNIIEEGLKEFRQNPQLGGLCSRCGVKPFHECGERAPGKYPTRWEYLIWLAQAFEYGLTDSTRADKSGDVKVMAGAFTLYTAEALRRVCKNRNQQNGQITVYDEGSEVEDYVLTLDVRASGLQALAGQTMRSWTDVPITLFGKGSLSKQRLRWYRGSTVEMMRRRFKSEIRRDVLMEAMQLFVSVARLTSFGMMALCAISPSLDFSLGLITLMLLGCMLAISWSIYIPGMRYFEHVSPATRLLPLTIIPMQLYSLWDDIVLYTSYLQSITNRRRKRVW